VYSFEGGFLFGGGFLVGCFLVGEDSWWDEILFLGEEILVRSVLTGGRASCWGGGEFISSGGILGIPGGTRFFLGDSWRGDSCGGFLMGRNSFWGDSWCGDSLSWGVLVQGSRAFLRSGKIKYFPQSLTSGSVGYLQCVSR
jgi:hypothetical protein